ncbi:DUF2062 domain-containing protein [Mangrovicella endophytica]|uniref:DUF2062 domain-containing protein n=1 Tax=Mangrovicella endophytica TaxID=2066697 RepID=UPI000C9E6799|nr:DUF2062 domain-containing protein [Mangrovicella endophytica]
MLFRRREKQGFGARMRTWLWPRRSFGRSALYLKKRVLRLHATPHAIAAGMAAGIFSSFTPFVGFHFVIAFAIAFCISGNMAAAALGTMIGNPATFPLIWAATYEVGHLILNARPVAGETSINLAAALASMDFWAVWTPLLKPMLVGALPIGGAAALLVYGLVFWAARSFQRHRSQRLLADMQQRPRTIRGGSIPEEHLS